MRFTRRPDASPEQKAAGHFEMIDFDFQQAFAPMFDKTAIVTGLRRENGIARSLKLAVPCGIFGGAQADGMNGASAPTPAREWSLTVRRSDWADHKPPQEGDAVSVTDYPAFKVAKVGYHSRDTWVLTCRSTEAAT
jgi:hypothetical protein